MTNWFIKYKKDNLQALKEIPNLSPLQRILLANRGLSTKEKVDEFLKPSIDDLHNPFLFEDMGHAIELIIDCLSSDQKIRIVGDYDQDGVAATTILVRGLRRFAEEMGRDPYSAVDYAIPDRIEDGYGINKEIVQRAYDENVGLLITCDNGIAAFEAIDFAKEIGLFIIVTDHHQLVRVDGEEKLPQADAILNPHIEDSAYPFKDLCGAGVAYKLIQAFALSIGLETDTTLNLLQFAALGTICDMVSLQGENRIIASLGLKELNENPSLGIQILLDLNSWDKEVNAYTVGFIIGPCINASGRLSTARIGVELFLEDDYDTAYLYAKELVDLNNERKAMTREGEEEAYQKLGSKTDDVILLYLGDVHESICGLIAGRVKDKYYRPSLVFTDAESDSEEPVLKGSGRSIEAYNMYEKLAPYRDRFISFGGHEMACGLSIYKKDFKNLQKILNESANLSETDMLPAIDLDLPLSFSRLDANIIETIDSLAPFGKDNPRPKFGASNCNVRALRLVGKNKNVLQVLLEQEGRTFQGVLFQGDEKLEVLKKENEGLVKAMLHGEDRGAQLDIVYRPEFNEFRGKVSIQLMLVDIRFARK